MDIDPDFFFDDMREEFGEDEYDDYDSIIDEEDLFDRIDNDLDDIYLEEFPEEVVERSTTSNDPLSNAELAGMAFAFGAEMRDEERKRKYDIDEKTDKENWDKAMRLTSLQSRHTTKKKKLRPFEQYVDDICKGKRPLFEDD